MFAVLLVAGCPTRAVAQSPAFTGTAEQQDARMDWWRGARFGMFIHWGIYSIPGRGEWVQWNEQIPVEEYARFADKFNPTNFNAGTWAAVAKDAGMKYMVLTARHHDGFAMFNDPGNPFTSVSTGVHRDFVAEYVEAVRKAGLHVGLYYSPLDWRFPGFFFPDLQLKSAGEMRDQYHRQMKELMSNYGKIDLVWFDGGESDWLSFNHDMSNPGFPTRKAGGHYHGRFDWNGGEVDQMMRQLQPQIIVNNRAAGVPPDYTSREVYIGDFDDQQPWETCDTLAGSWGYWGDADPKPLKKCIQLLVNVVGRDGNLLLNIGPRPDGSIVPSQVQRLHEIGGWLGKYGGSIYATRGGPFLPGDYGVSTHHDKIIYVHVLKWPEGKFVLPPLPARIVHAAALTGGEVSFNQTAQAIELSVPQTNRSDIDTIITLELDQTANGIKPLPVGSKP